MQKIIDISTPNDGLGDVLRTGFDKTNQNFTELYNGKVDKITGKGLSENDFTDLDKSKLDGIEVGAQVNVNADFGENDPDAPGYILNKPPALYSAVGHFHFSDLATQTTPLALLPDVHKKLTNDTLGAYTELDYAPYGVSAEFWNTTNNQFDFSNLTLGDSLLVRTDLHIVTTSANQTFTIYLKLGIGTASEYNLLIDSFNVKTIITDLHIIKDVSFSIDNDDWNNAPAEVYILSDDDATIKVNGWYVPIVRKSVNIIDFNSDPLKLDKVTTNDVEKVYIKNADGTQSMKPTSEFVTTTVTGTINRISKFTAGGTIGDSQIFDNGTNVGIGTTSPQARLDVRAQGVLATDIVLRVRNSTDTQNFLVVNGAGDVYNNGAKGVNTNTFFGENVGRNATGIYNTAIGVSALRTNTTGNSNAAIGTGALLSNTTGASNAAIGVSALLSNTTGYSNMAIGQSALRDNTTGYSNAAIGVSALLYNTTGAYNTAIGSGAGRLIADGSNNTITNESIFIGDDTRALADNQINQIVIGYRAIGLGSDSVVLGNELITITQLRGQVIMGVFASPPTGIEGAIYYDSTKKKHYGFDGITWNALY